MTAAGPFAGSTVVVAGATGPAGAAAARALLARSATVVALAHDRERLDALATALPGLLTEQLDLADTAAVAALAGRLRERHGRVDGLVHLVGGWRGGRRFTDNTDADWRFLSTALVDTLRATTLGFHDDIRASPIGRVVTVSATAVDRPTAGGANYAAAKAAADTWMRSLARSLGRPVPDPGGTSGTSGTSGTDGAGGAGGATVPVERPSTAAATVLVVTALTDRSRPTDPPAPPSFTDVTDLAERIVGLFDVPAAEVNGLRLPA